MLKRNRPTTLATKFSLEGQGETTTHDVVFNNIKSSDVDSLFAENKTVAELVNTIVNKFDGDDVSIQAINDIEDEYPGFCVELLDLFHETRKVKRAKN